MTMEADEPTIFLQKTASDARVEKGGGCEGGFSIWCISDWGWRRVMNVVRIDIFLRSKHD